MQETAYERLKTALVNSGLQVKTQSNTGFIAQCPAHDDKNPSLSVTDNRQGERTLIYCHAGCEYKDVLGALGLSPSDLYDTPREKEEYRYLDRDKSVNRIIVRNVNKKTFYKKHLGGKEKPVILYNLPNVIEAVKIGRPIYFVEGEKDADNGNTMTGEVFTTAPFGGENVGKADMTPLKGAHVIAIEDKDSVGEKWKEKLAGALNGVAKRIEWKKAESGKDLTTHLADGGTLQTLKNSTPPKVKKRKFKLVGVEDMSFTNRGDIWKGRIPQYAPTVLAGDSGIGKSFMAIHLAAQYSNGTLEGDCEGIPRNVIYVDLDNGSAQNTAFRVKSAGANPDYIKFPVIDLGNGETEMPTSGEILNNLESCLEQYPDSLVILDPASNLLEGKNDSADDVSKFMRNFQCVAEKTKTTFLLVAHTNKGGGRAGDKILGSVKWKAGARSMLLMAANEEKGTTVLSHVKSNDTELAEDTEYKITENKVSLDGIDKTVGVLQYVGVSSISAEALINKQPASFEETTKTGFLVSFFRNYFRGQTSSAEDNKLFQEAGEAFYAQYGETLSRSTYQRAKTKAHLKTGQRNVGESWIVYPEGKTPPAFLN